MPSLVLATEELVCLCNVTDGIDDNFSYSRTGKSLRLRKNDTFVLVAVDTVAAIRCDDFDDDDDVDDAQRHLCDTLVCSLVFSFFLFDLTAAEAVAAAVTAVTPFVLSVLLLLLLLLMLFAFVDFPLLLWSWSFVKPTAESSFFCAFDNVNDDDVDDEGCFVFATSATATAAVTVDDDDDCCC